MEKKRGIRLDPLYRVIDEPDDIQFVEGNFKRLFDRLKDISNLGIIPEVFKMAKYSKFEHSFGTVHQVVNLLETTKLPVEYHRPLILAALFLHLGHLPFTYSSERALLIACNNQDKPKKQNRAKEYVEKRVNRCLKKCPKFDDTDHADLLNDLLSLRDFTTLYRYFAGELIEEAFGVLQKRFDDLSQEGLLFALQNLIDKEAAGYKYLDLADTCDFVQRDALYFGSIRLDIAPKHLYSQLPKLTPSSRSKKKLIDQDFFDEAKLIKTNLDYLDEHFYKDPDVVWFSAIYEKIAASLMNDKNFKFELLGEYNDDQFKTLITTNSDIKGAKARLSPKWIERASRLFDKKINFELAFNIDAVMPDKRGVIDIECELVSKKSNESSYLSYPFEVGILLAADRNRDNSYPILPNYASFSIKLFQDTQRRCLMPLLRVTKQLSRYLTVSGMNTIREGLGSQISPTRKARFDNSDVIRALAEAIQLIEKDSGKTNDFIKRYSNSLTRLKTFRDLWYNFENYSAIVNPRPFSAPDKIAEMDMQEYEAFVEGLLSLPLQLLQFKSTKKFLDDIYRKVQELAQTEATTGKKGAFFEALCLVHVMREPKGRFQLILNDMVVVEPDKPEGQQDGKEFDIVELVINDAGKAECHIYACSVAKNYKSKNAPALGQLADSIHNSLVDTIPIATYLKPTSKDDCTPWPEESGIGYRDPKEESC